MDFELSDALKTVQETARNFAEKELKPRAIEDDETKEFPAGPFKKMGELGLIGTAYPEEYGGGGLGELSYVLAVEEISKVHAALGITLSVCASLFSGAIFNNASEAQKKKYLPEVLAGTKIGAFGVTEPNAGSDLGNLQTVAVKKGDHYVLNGSKIFITNAPIADYFFVAAVTDKSKGAKGISAFIVEKGTKGFSVGKRENTSGLRSAQVAELIFQDVEIPAENLVGEEGKGFIYALGTLDGGRIGVAAQALGIAEGAFERTVEYLKQRVQFGRPLYKQEYISFKMADMATEIEAAKYIVYKAALDKDKGGRFSVSAAKAKLIAAKTAVDSTLQAIQFHGGYGYTKEFEVERMLRDAKVTEIYEGTSEVQRMVIGGSLFR